eukprot:5789282-Prymnesium_polylepis.1
MLPDVIEKLRETSLLQERAHPHRHDPELLDPKPPQTTPDPHRHPEPTLPTFHPSPLPHAQPLPHCYAHPPPESHHCRRSRTAPSASFSTVTRTATASRCR